MLSHSKTMTSKILKFFFNPELKILPIQIINVGPIYKNQNSILKLVYLTLVFVVSLPSAMSF